jgi:hypothetical protein
VGARKEELEIKKGDENDLNFGIKEYTVQTKSKISRESISGMGHIGLKAHPKKLNRESKIQRPQHWYRKNTAMSP